jgi:gentisate 1,2-dioxygenase
VGTAARPRHPHADVAAKPYHWNYDDVVRPFMMESGGLITAKEAERRVLILENPGLAGNRASPTRCSPACR